jgi:hypothetical protein
MNIDDILNVVSNYSNIENEELAIVYKQLGDITQQFNVKTISQNEYFELIHDLNTERAIIETAADYEAKVQLKIIIEAALAIASVAAKAI